MLVDVLLPLNFDQTFTYKIDQKAEVGNIVLVSFKNKEIIGVIWSLNSESLKKGIKIKKIIKILDLPAFSINKINFIKQMSNYNLIKKGLVLNLFLYKNGLKSFEKGLKKINDFRKNFKLLILKPSTDNNITINQIYFEEFENKYWLGENVQTLRPIKIKKSSSIIFYPLILFLSAFIIKTFEFH